MASFTKKSVINDIEKLRNGQISEAELETKYNMSHAQVQQLGKLKGKKLEGRISKFMMLTTRTSGAA